MTGPPPISAAALDGDLQVREREFPRPPLRFCVVGNRLDALDDDSEAPQLGVKLVAEHGGGAPGADGRGGVR